MEPTKQVPIRRGTMPQQHASVGLHRLATLPLWWTTNNEAYCERVPDDLLRRRHLRTTPSTWCGLHLPAETKFEIVKANDNNNNYFQACSRLNWLQASNRPTYKHVGGLTDYRHLTGLTTSRNVAGLTDYRRLTGLTTSRNVAGLLNFVDAWFVVAAIFFCMTHFPEWGSGWIFALVYK